jgi:hypothetical protein
VRRSSELRRVRFGQYIAGLQCIRPGFVVTEHPHYFLVSWYPRVVEHRGDEGAVKTELVGQAGAAEPRSSATKVDFRRCLRWFGLSLCGFRLCHNQANHNGQVKWFFHLCIPAQPGTAISHFT